jgi:hypothetical protein
MALESQICYNRGNKTRGPGGAGNAPEHDRTTLEVAGMPSLSTYAPRDKFSRTTPAQVEVACTTCGRPLFLMPARVRRAKRFFCDKRCYAGYSAVSLVPRLFSRVDRQANGCWRWTGAIDQQGYGRIDVGAPSHTMVYVHRVMYELHRGAIPAGLHIDHLCRNRWCCNPDHLEAVTSGENFRRGMSPSAVQARSSFCIRGHEFTPDNTRIYRNGRRVCMQCQREHWRKWREQHGGAANA